MTCVNEKGRWQWSGSTKAWILKLNSIENKCTVTVTPMPVDHDSESLQWSALQWQSLPFQKWWKTLPTPTTKPFKFKTQPWLWHMGNGTGSSSSSSQVSNFNSLLLSVVTFSWGVFLKQRLTLTLSDPECGNVVGQGWVQNFWTVQCSVSRRPAWKAKSSHAAVLWTQYPSPANSLPAVKG